MVRSVRWRIRAARANDLNTYSSRTIPLDGSEFLSSHVSSSVQRLGTFDGGRHFGSVCYLEVTGVSDDLPRLGSSESHLVFQN